MNLKIDDGKAKFFLVLEGRHEVNVFKANGSLGRACPKLLFLNPMQCPRREGLKIQKNTTKSGCQRVYCLFFSRSLTVSSLTFKFSSEVNFVCGVV